MSKIPRNTRRAGFFFGREPADPCLRAIAAPGVCRPTVTASGNPFNSRGAATLFGAPLRRRTGVIGNETEWVGRFLGCQIRGMCQLWRRVCADVNLLAVNANLCAPSAMRMSMHTQEPALVGFVSGSHVLHVLLRRSLAQILDSVVTTYAVLVVNGRGECSTGIEPCKAMSGILFSIDADRYIAVTSDRPRNAFPLDWAAIKAPAESAGQRVVVKQFTKPFGGKRIVHGG